jgi:hypothetical protein
VLAPPHGTAKRRASDLTRAPGQRAQRRHRQAGADRKRHSASPGEVVKFADPSGSAGGQEISDTLRITMFKQALGQPPAKYFASINASDASPSQDAH